MCVFTYPGGVQWCIVSTLRKKQTTESTAKGMREGKGKMHHARPLGTFSPVLLRAFNA